MKYLSYRKSPVQMSAAEVLKAGNEVCLRVNKITRDLEKHFGNTPKRVVLSANLFFLMAEYAVICEEFSRTDSDDISLEQFLREENFVIDTGIGVIPCDINACFRPNKIVVEWEHQILSETKKPSQ